MSAGTGPHALTGDAEGPHPGVGKAWPPTDSPTDERPGGYVRGSLEASRLADAMALGRDGRAAVAIGVAAWDDGRLSATPLRLDDGAPRWRVAAAGDGVSAALIDVAREGVHPAGRFDLVVRAPLPEARGERPMGVDQTHASVIVGESVVVKWLSEAGHGFARAALTLDHLLEAGFDEMPTPMARLTWFDDAGHERVLVMLDAFLPAARDGWEWCVESLERQLEGAPVSGGGWPVSGGGWPAQLGALAGRLHLALATPTHVLAEPVHRVDGSETRSWAGHALDLAEEAAALDAADAHIVRSLLDVIREVLVSLEAVTDTSVMPLHGDLHVGQVLRWEGGLAVIDFDGAPFGLLGGTHGPSRELPVRGPAAYDVAQLLCSVDHVARIVARRRADAGLAPRDDRLAAWSRSARAGLLDGYRAVMAKAGRADLLDQRLLLPLMLAQECRELLYAARVLPRWRYAPLATLQGLITEARSEQR